MRVVGIDLAGSPKRRTGYCLFAGGRVETRVLYTDTDILRALYEDNPEIVAVDAPLSLPFGRCCLLEECSCRGKAHLRACDKTLLSMKIHFFPITLGPMRLLTTRGMKLAESLAERGIRTIEVYPGAAQDLWGIPRKQKDVEGLRTGLEGVGLCSISKGLSHDELDAISCALVGKDVLEGKGLAVGIPQEGLMFLPAVENQV
jgi:hypothetical protein